MSYLAAARRVMYQPRLYCNTYKTYVNLVPSFNMVLRIGRSFLVTSRNVKEKMFLKL